MKDEKKTKKEEEKIENKEISSLKERNEDLENKYKRALADYQNLEKRVSEERRALIISANKELIFRLLPVLDTLMLASKHVEDQGLKLSIQQFLAVLKGEGVTRIETENKDFNPEIMECVTVIKGKEGKVLEEIRTGYMLGDKVLRPAQVVVGKEKIDEKDEQIAKEESQKGDYM